MDADVQCSVCLGDPEEDLEQRVLSKGSAGSPQARRWENWDLSGDQVDQQKDVFQIYPR